MIFLFFCLIHSIAANGLRRVESTQTIPIPEVNQAFPHNKIKKMEIEGESNMYKFSYEDIDWIGAVDKANTPKIQELVNTFGERIEDIDHPAWLLKNQNAVISEDEKTSEPDWHTEDGLERMVSLPGKTSDHPILPVVAKRMYIATLAEDTPPGKEPSTKEGNIVSACQCDVVNEPTECIYGQDQIKPPCGYLAAMNTLSDFESNGLSTELAYQCYKFLKDDRKIKYVSVHNYGGKGGAISYTRGAGRAGFTSFKTDCMTQWMPIPMTMNQRILDVPTFLSCMVEGNCDPASLAHYPAGPNNNCRGSTTNFINKRHIYYTNKHDADQTGDTFEQHEVDTEEEAESYGRDLGTKYYSNKRTRRTSWNKHDMSKLPSNDLGITFGKP